MARKQLGFPTAEHARVARIKADSAKRSADSAIKKIQKGNCDGAIASLLAAHQKMGEARAHDASLRPAKATAKAVVEAQRAVVRAGRDYRLRCVLKRPRRS
jgi:hypothetical protein